MPIASPTAGTVKAASKPYVASLSPESAAHNESLKADLLRTLLRIGLLSAAGGAGTGLLTHYLGRHSVKFPGADDPDVELPYPQPKQASLSRPVLMAAATPPVFAAVHGLAGAASTPDAPGAGAAYGAASGLLRGLGAAGGGYLASKIPNVTGGSTGLEKILYSLVGGTLGNVLAGRAAKPLLKTVAGEPPWKRDHEKKGDWADTVVKATMPTPAGEPPPAPFSPRWLRGDAQTSTGSIPWAIPGMMAAGMGGLYGGHHLIRWLLRKKRKAELARELEHARKEYEAAMLGQYDPAHLQPLDGKAAAADDRLDQLYASWREKTADFGELLGKGTGLYLLAAGLLGGGTGVATYNYLQGRSKAKMLEKALKHRALLRGLANPPDVYLHPVPAELEDKKHKKDHEAES